MAENTFPNPNHIPISLEELGTCHKCGRHSIATFYTTLCAKCLQYIFNRPQREMDKAIKSNEKFIKNQKQILAQQILFNRGLIQHGNTLDTVYYNQRLQQQETIDLTNRVNTFTQQQIHFTFQYPTLFSNQQTPSPPPTPGSESQ